MAMNIKISNELTFGLAMNSWKWFRVLLVLSLPIIIVEFLLQHNCASLFIVRLLHNWPAHPCDCALCTFCTFCSLDRRHQLLLIPPTIIPCSVMRLWNPINAKRRAEIRKTGRLGDNSRGICGPWVELPISTRHLKGHRAWVDHWHPATGVVL